MENEEGIRGAADLLEEEVEAKFLFDLDSLAKYSGYLYNSMIRQTGSEELSRDLTKMWFEKFQILAEG